MKFLIISEKKIVFDSWSVIFFRNFDRKMPVLSEISRFSAPKILRIYFSRQRGMITRQNPYPTEPINHERIIINYENPKVASSSSAGYSHHHHSYDGHAAMTSRDSDTGSTDSGKPSSLSSNKQPRPTSFRNRYNALENTSVLPYNFNGSTLKRPVKSIKLYPMISVLFHLARHVPLIYRIRYV